MPSSVWTTSSGSASASAAPTDLATGAAVSAAAAAAAAAQASANTALAGIANIVSDNVLSKGEKSAVIQDWSVLSSERAGIDAQADAYAVSRAAYDSALSSLSIYLSGLSPAWNDTTQDTSIVGTTFRTNWANAYTAKTSLLNAIYAAAKALADAAQGTANTAVANAATAQAAANAAQASANAANAELSNIASDNVLSSGEKSAVIQDYNVITSEQAGIDAQATAYGVSHTTYDSAVSNLTSYLGTLTTPTAWNSATGDTTIVGTTFRSKFSDVYTTRQAVLNSVYAAAKARADAAQTSANSALTKISDASADGIITDLERPGLKTLRATLALAVSAAQSQANGMGVGHSTLDSAWSTFTTNVDPVLAATGNSTITKATWDGWWSTVYQEVQNLQGVLATTANNAAAYANTLARSSNNLIKNGNSEDANPVGLEANAIHTGTPYAGTKCRLIAGTGAQINVDVARFPVAPGEQIYASAMALVYPTGAYYLNIKFEDASGAHVNSAAVSGASIGSYAALSVSSTAGANATSCIIQIISQASTPVGSYVYFDNLYACRKISAGMLEADLAIVGVIRSPNYVAGAYGAAPVGFKQSGYAFTTTYIDGTTDANCYMELGGSANFGGYKVATVTNRTMTAYNRILNGGFYSNLNGWTQNNANTAWNSATDVSGLGSVAINVTTGTLPKAGSIIQPFSCPPTSATVNLTLKTAVSAPSAGYSLTSSGSYVKVYLTNMSTGVETLLATWNYSTSPASPSWTSRSVNVTSYVSGGGDFALRVELSIQTPISGDSCLTYARDIKILI